MIAPKPNQRNCPTMGIPMPSIGNPRFPALASRLSPRGPRPPFRGNRPILGIPVPSIGKTNAQRWESLVSGFRLPALGSQLGATARPRQSQCPALGIRGFRLSPPSSRLPAWGIRPALGTPMPSTGKANAQHWSILGFRLSLPGPPNLFYVSGPQRRFLIDCRGENGSYT